MNKNQISNVNVPWLKKHKEERTSRKDKIKRERIRLRSQSKRKKYARPNTEKEHLETAQACIAKVLRTLQSNGLQLSLTDKDDAFQAGMLALVKIGFFESGIVDKNTFRAISREIESRDCLRLNATWEVATEFQTLESLGVFHEYENPENLSHDTRDALKACFEALRMAREVSESRKAKSEHATHRDFLIACVSTLTNSGNVSPINPATFRKRKQRLFSYLQIGAKELHARADHHETISGDILANLEKNFLK